MFEVNRTPAHSNHKCFTHDPQSGEYSDLTQSLDGEWHVEIVQASDIDQAGDVVTAETAVPGSKARWEGACVDRVNSMLRRDYNHPSVVIWSLGNESYTGDVFRAMYKHVHDIDPNRPVHYEGVTKNRDYDDVTDIETRMYEHADELVLEVSQHLAEATDWAPAGYELAFGQTIVAGTKAAEDAALPADGIVTVGRWNAGVQGSGREILLSRTQGGLVSYTFDGHEFVLRRPAITTFRALTDNDRGAGHGFERAQWMTAGRYARCVDNVIEQVDEDTLKAVYTYELATPRTRFVAGTYPANTNTPNVPPSAGFHVSVWPVARFRIETSRKPPCLAVAPSNSIW